MIVERKGFFKRGGVHPPERKLTKNAEVIDVPLDGDLYVAISQGLGKPPKPIVAKGDKVKRGQLIAEPTAFISSSIHAPTSGTVKGIDLYPHPNGTLMPAITITPDGEDAWSESLPPPLPLDGAPQTFIERIAWAGILGLGGAAFPTSVKLSPPPEHKIDYVLLNGAECEPYLTSDYRLMMDYPDDICAGLDIFIRALTKDKSPPTGIICVEDNKRDAAEKLSNAARNYKFDVMLVRTMYPQGAEKQLIEAATGRKLKPRNLPMTVGAVVQNVATAKAAADAVLRGRPLDTRIVTVTGDMVEKPGNYRVRLGTPLERVLAVAGGIKKGNIRVILGGPMMGLPQSDLRVMMCKGNGGVLVLSADEKRDSWKPCIRCGRCVDACPLGIFPNEYGLLMEESEENFGEAIALSAGDCFECASCAYICPSKRPLVQWIKFAKAKFMSEQAKKREQKIAQQ